MISARLDIGASLLLLAPVRGLEDEARASVAALEAFSPEVVGAGVEAEELDGLVKYFVNAPAEPVVPLAAAELSEVRGLCRFGQVRVPNPAFLGAIAWARDRGVVFAPLDPDEERSAELFRENIGYVELVRRTLREHRLGRSPPTPSSADAYALAWDRTVGGGRGSRRLAGARDAYLAERARRLAQGRRRVAVLVDRERFERVRDLLGAPAPPRGRRT